MIDSDPDSQALHEDDDLLLAEAGRGGTAEKNRARKKEAATWAGGLAAYWCRRSVFFSALLDRAIWLIGLLAFQSASSFVLEANTGLIARHKSIIFFLTMLVGAGGKLK